MRSEQEVGGAVVAAVADRVMPGGDPASSRAVCLSAEPADDPSSLPTTHQGQLTRWRAHLAARGRVGPPEVADFLAYGSLSTIERLRPALAAAAPEEAGPLRLACAALRQGKARRRRTTGGARGPARTLSLREDELPEAWRAHLDAMRRARARLDAGRSSHGRDGRRPPAAPMIGHIAYVLRALAWVCVDRGEPIGLRRPILRAWLDAARARGVRPTSTGAQLRLVQAYLHWTGERPRLAREIGDLAAHEARRGRLGRKRKEERLLARPASIASVWAAAEAARAQAEAHPPASRARMKAHLEAAALALDVAAPLRIGDLHRLFVGESLARDAEGWSLRIATRKTGAPYEHPRLWPELTPFLDAVLAADAPGGDPWAGYDARCGTRFFSYDGGRTGLSADWLSDAFERRTGHGAHIVRTLWHDHVAQADGAEGVWIALALCGQRDARTARHYQTEATRRARTGQGRALLRAARQGAGRAPGPGAG